MAIDRKRVRCAEPRAEQLCGDPPALGSPATSDADVDRHTELFSEAVADLF